MKKKKNIAQPQGSSGFDGLISVHTEALKDNSIELERALRALSKKDIPKGLMNMVKHIKKEFKRLDDELDNLEED